MQTAAVMNTRVLIIIATFITEIAIKLVLMNTVYMGVVSYTDDVRQNTMVASLRSFRVSQDKNCISVHYYVHTRTVNIITNWNTEHNPTVSCKPGI